MTTATMTRPAPTADQGRTFGAPLTNRMDFLFIYDVTNGNPNGNPDNGNSPRTDPETGHGMVSDVCLKRKARDQILKQLRGPNNPFGTLDPARYDIFMRSDEVLNDLQEQAYAAIGRPVSGGEKKAKSQKGSGKDDTKVLARKWMCDRYFDIRAFGAMMETGLAACGGVRGPVWFGISTSVDQIYDNELTIVRKAITRTEDAHKTGTIGKKNVIPYGLYVMKGAIDPLAAQESGFDLDDLAQLWDALLWMFEHDKSATRGEMHPQKLLVFEHAGAFNKVHSHKLHDLVRITRKVDVPRKFGDYEVVVDKDKLPASVKLIEML